MIAYAAVPLTCWLCALLAIPHKPRLGDEIEALVYARLLGRQELLRLLAIVATGVAFFAFVLALPPHGARDAGYSQVGSDAGYSWAGSYYCTSNEADFPQCYSLESDGS